jgi:biopolymer transport protein ExbD
MAEISDSGGGGGGKHGKKGRKKGGSPRVDMTPMVDLAFLLLTFFVLTSNLNKAKTMEMAVPADCPECPPTEIDNDLANTIILDGNKDGVIYFYHGKLTPDSTELFELVLDPAAGQNVRKSVKVQNTVIQEKVDYVRQVYKSGKLSAENKSKIMGYVTLATQPNSNGKELPVVTEEKKKKYTECSNRLEADLQKGEMQDSTFRVVVSTIKNDDAAPFFIVKWGGEATFGDVINIMDELKIGDASKYSLTKVSCTELRALNAYQASHGQTVRQYEELNGPDCNQPEEGAGGAPPAK